MDIQDLDVIKRRVFSVLINRGGPFLPGPIALTAARGYRERAHKIAAWLYARQDTVLGPGGPVECCNCSPYGPGVKYARYEYAAFVFDTPWQTEGHYLHFCSDECRDVYLHDGDFSYRYCEACEREICQQNPANGWHWQFRDLEDGEELCLSCYEAFILENGCEREKFERGQLPGMFFSGDNHEPLEAGYSIVPGYDNTFIRGSGSEACKVALELMDKGALVICGYESMGIGGGEGYITLFAKGGPDLGAWAEAKRQEALDKFNQAVNG